MGVFARLLRRSKATEEAPAAEAQTEAAEAGSAEAAGAAEAATEKGPAGTAEPAEPTAGTPEVTETESVDIPKQQSSDKAADNEAGESART